MVHTYVPISRITTSYWKTKNPTYRSLSLKNLFEAMFSAQKNINSKEEKYQQIYQTTKFVIEDKTETGGR